MMEALGILQEECAEVIQAVSKIRRTGETFRPFGGEKSNLDLLAEEIEDVLILLEICGVPRLGAGYRDAKIAKLRKWSNIVPENFQ